MKKIDSEIEDEYEHLVAIKYLPVVKKVVEEKTIILKDNGIPYIDLSAFVFLLILAMYALENVVNSLMKNTLIETCAEL